MQRTGRRSGRYRVVSLRRPRRILIVGALVCAVLFWGGDVVGGLSALARSLTNSVISIGTTVSGEADTATAPKKEVNFWKTLFGAEGIALPGTQQESGGTAAVGTTPSSDTQDAPTDGGVTQMDTGADTEAADMQEYGVLYRGESPDPGLENALPVANVTIKGTDGESIALRNETKYDIDIPALLSKKNAFKMTGDGPHVLIIHTHGSEAYTPDGKNYYTPDDPDRTTDTRFNVVRVGDALASMLEDAGISTVHIETLHDYPSYNGSYSRSLETIAATMKKYPSIKVVIDIHRDAMISEDGVKYKPVTTIDGQRAAQMMLVIGSDEGGLPHDGWRSNLSFALKLQHAVSSQYENLMRPVNIRRERFNQHATAGSILLEVGSSGNTLDEALHSVRLFGDVLIEQLRGYIKT